MEKVATIFLMLVFMLLLPLLGSHRRIVGAGSASTGGQGGAVMVAVKFE
jgi:hypothetical protein